MSSFFTMVVFGLDWSVVSHWSRSASGFSAGDRSRGVSNPCPPVSYPYHMPMLQVTAASQPTAQSCVVREW